MPPPLSTKSCSPAKCRTPWSPTLSTPSVPNLAEVAAPISSRTAAAPRWNAETRPRWSSNRIFSPELSKSHQTTTLRRRRKLRSQINSQFPKGRVNSSRRSGRRIGPRCRTWRTRGLCPRITSLEFRISCSPCLQRTWTEQMANRPANLRHPTSIIALASTFSMAAA